MKLKSIKSFWHRENYRVKTLIEKDGYPVDVITFELVEIEKCFD